VLGQRVQELELAAGELEALAADVRLEAVGHDLQLSRDQRPNVLACLATTVAANHGFDPRHNLLRVARLRDPVVGAQAKPANPLGHRRALRADDDAEARQHPADSLEELPGQRPQQSGVDEKRVQLHRRQLFGRHRTREDPVLVTGPLEALREHAKETGVVVDDGYSKCSRLDAHQGVAARQGPAWPTPPRTSEPQIMVVTWRSS
jgi:hypothetical protein